MSQVQTQRGDPKDIPKAEWERGYQDTAVPGISVLLGVIGLLATIVLSGALVMALVWYFRDTVPPPSATALEAAPIVPPAPRLETSPQGDGAAIRAKNRAKLTGYGYAGDSRDRAHVPIGRAMAVLAGRGWPDNSGGMP